MARAAFEREVQNAEGILVNRIRSYETLLTLAEAAIDPSGRRLTKAVDGSLLTDLLQRQYPAVAALGWITKQGEARATVQATLAIASKVFLRLQAARGKRSGCPRRPRSRTRCCVRARDSGSHPAIS